MGLNRSAKQGILALLLQFLNKLKSANAFHWLFFVFFYAVLTNVPFWAASSWLGLLPLGWCCLEYAGVGLLALFVPRILAAALLLLVMAADLISAASKTYYLSPTECLVNVGFLRELPGKRLVALALVAGFMLLITSIAAFLPAQALRGADRWKAAVCLTAFVAIGLTLDCMSAVRETGQVPNPIRMATPGDEDRFSDFRNLWIARYPTIRLVRDERLFGGRRRRTNRIQQDAGPAESAAALAARFAGLASGMHNRNAPNLVVIVVESWGLAYDPSLRNWLVHAYSQPELLARYQVVQGTVPFNGPTVSGEARELCGSRMSFRIETASRRELQDCLPGRLTLLGYHSIALHGMDGHMFSRSSWYSSIGFQEQWFRDDLRQQGLPDCAGAFTGTCDAPIAEWIGRRLERREAQPMFVYWMTLNSHLPVPIPSSPLAELPCSLTPMLTENRALCYWFQLVDTVHESVSRLATSDLARPTVFAIVGDHAPPFSNPMLRNQFSSTAVPYVLLVPREHVQKQDLAEVHPSDTSIRTASRLASEHSASIP